MYLDDSTSKHTVAIFQRGVDYVLDRMRRETEIGLASVQTRHFGCFTDEPIQAVTLLIDDGEKLAFLRIVQARVGKQVGDGRFDRGKRSAEIVRDRVEQRGAQTLSFPRRFGLAKLLDGAGALHRYRDQRSQRFERLPRQNRAGNSQAADRTHAHAHRNETKAAGNVQDRLLARDNRLEAFEIELRNRGAGTIHFLFVGQQQGRRAYFEGVHDLGRNAVQQLNHVARFEQALAERV